MEEIQEQLNQWGEELIHFRLPRWDEMPDLELYMDQVVKLLDGYLSSVLMGEKQPLLTAAMVNNYVKNDLIPPPVKKKYTRKHLAFLVAITLLKQILTISEIKEGIVFQGKVTGIREAYNLFCTEQEYALQEVGRQLLCLPHTGFFTDQISVEQLALKSATVSFATKLLAKKMIELEESFREKVKA